jgi:hypothetical protein
MGAVVSNNPEIAALSAQIQALTQILMQIPAVRGAMGGSSS